MNLRAVKGLQAYRKMREIRTFEERLHQENTSGDIPGFIHLYTRLFAEHRLILLNKGHPGGANRQGG
jgi:hypothetical protein